MAQVQAASYGITHDGQAVDSFTLRNAHGLEVCAINFGGTIVSLRVPDRAGNFDDVVLGFDSLASYETISPYFGCIVGRYANRIGGAHFMLDGKSYQLARNNGPNSLHGGLRGFDKVVWQAEPTDSGVLFRYRSADGEEGFPGNLDVEVEYTLTEDDSLSFDFHATTDAATPVNLTQHNYFNLAGHRAHDILDHIVTINAERFTPVDAGLIPTGELRSVAGTPFDFRAPVTIGSRIDAADEQLRIGHGYDHNFVLNKSDAELSLAARIVEPKSGRVLEILTTEPGMQFYTGNFLNETIIGKDGVAYGKRHGFAIETQHFPDSPNQPAFPSTILRPGQQYRSRTVCRFSVQP
jgi:aldose 1-epimerase